jgi:hypothetical protein
MRKECDEVMRVSSHREMTTKTIALFDSNCMRAPYHRDTSAVRIPTWLDCLGGVTVAVFAFPIIGRSEKDCTTEK